MHLVQVVIKNTSTLDYSLPILWGFRKKYPDSKISIVYMCMSNQQIVRGSFFITRFCRENRIDQYDYQSFVKKRYVNFSSFFSLLFNSFSDTSTSSSLQSSKKIGGFDISFLLSRLEKLFAYFVSKYAINHNLILELMSPDVILFDNRSESKFMGRKAFFKYLDDSRIPVVLLPHAPHYIGKTAEFCQFDEENANVMPDYTEHWMPFQAGEPWLLHPSKYSQFINIGYPGLDSTWCSYLLTNQTKSENKTIKCMVLGRKFLAKGVKRPDNFDMFTQDYDDAFNFFKMICDAQKIVDSNIEIVIKPHPSCCRRLLMQLLNDVGLKKYDLSYEFFYHQLPSTDLVVTDFTTAISIPLAFKVPVILLESKLQRYVNSKWSILSDYYSSLNNYVSADCFLEKFQWVVNNLDDGVESDFQRMRNYFPDEAMSRALNRLDVLFSVSDSLGTEH